MVHKTSPSQPHTSVTARTRNAPHDPLMCTLFSAIDAAAVPTDSVAYQVTKTHSMPNKQRTGAAADKKGGNAVNTERLATHSPSFSETESGCTTDHSILPLKMLPESYASFHAFNQVQISSDWEKTSYPVG